MEEADISLEETVMETSPDFDESLDGLLHKLPAKKLDKERL